MNTALNERLARLEQLLAPKMAQNFQFKICFAGEDNEKFDPVDALGFFADCIF